MKHFLDLSQIDKTELKNIVNEAKRIKLNYIKDKKVSVLIKNNKTRKKIQQEQILLRKKKIHDIKSELIESGLLKYGSTAPNYILRSLYENAILSGEVKNTSDAILLHNYMSKK